MKGTFCFGNISNTQKTGMLLGELVAIANRVELLLGGQISWEVSVTEDTEVKVSAEVSFHNLMVEVTKKGVRKWCVNKRRHHSTRATAKAIVNALNV